jgi:hypothetical protein
MIAKTGGIGICSSLVSQKSSGIFAHDFKKAVAVVEWFQQGKKSAHAFFFLFFCLIGSS